MPDNTTSRKRGLNNNPELPTDVIVEIIEKIITALFTNLNNKVANKSNPDKIQKQIQNILELSQTLINKKNIHKCSLSNNDSKTIQNIIQQIFKEKFQLQNYDQLF